MACPAASMSPEATPIHDRAMLGDRAPLGLRDVIGLGIPDPDDRLDGRADSFEDRVPGGVSDRQMETRVALHECAMVHRLGPHLLDGRSSCETRSSVLLAAARRAHSTSIRTRTSTKSSRLPSLSRRPQRKPPDRSSDVGSRTKEPSPARASRTPSTTRLFTASRIVERPTWNRIANSFSEGMRSPGFQTLFMIRSVSAFTISCGSVARLTGLMSVPVSLMSGLRLRPTARQIPKPVAPRVVRDVALRSLR